MRSACRNIFISFFLCLCARFVQRLKDIIILFPSVTDRRNVILRCKSHVATMFLRYLYDGTAAAHHRIHTDFSPEYDICNVESGISPNSSSRAPSPTPETQN